jgi:hypothetical protein
MFTSAIKDIPAGRTDLKPKLHIRYPGVEPENPVSARSAFRT